MARDLLESAERYVLFQLTWRSREQSVHGNRYLRYVAYTASGTGISNWRMSCDRLSALVEGISPARLSERIYDLEKEKKGKEMNRKFERIRDGEH